ncbi:MAG: hypothetical protein RR588_03330 [Solibacillus sp.]
MKTTKIIIKNLFGIAERELDGTSVELSGAKGTGKTSVIDSIRYALTNASDRDYIVKNGEKEGEILIETDTGLSINRKKRTSQSDYKSIKEFNKEITQPQAFLNDIFTPLQLDPVAFTQMSRQEQNRIILDLIEFDWDMNWIKEKFGEIPTGIDYEQNILQILNDIQAEKGVYFQRRQDVNRDIRNKQAMIADVAKDIPVNYNAEKWDKYDLGEQFTKLETLRQENAKIEKSKAFKEAYDNKVKGLQAQRDIEIAAQEKTVANERENLLSTIERLKAEIVAAEDKIKHLTDTLKDKTALANADYNANVAELTANVEVANKYADKKPYDVSELSAEISNAEAMKKHLNEYARMKAYQKEVEDLNVQSEEYTRKIELARELPSEILKTATIPIAGLAVVDGLPLINGLPVSNLSDGEKLDLCVDVAISKKNGLQMILIDGAERLDDKSRDALYQKCKEKGLQIVAAKTTNDNELVVTEL